MSHKSLQSVPYLLEKEHEPKCEMCFISGLEVNENCTELFIVVKTLLTQVGATEN